LAPSQRSTPFCSPQNIVAFEKRKKRIKQIFPSIESKHKTFIGNISRIYYLCLFNLPTTLHASMSPHAVEFVPGTGEPIVYDHGDGYLANNNKSIAGCSIGSGIILDKTPSAIASDGTLTSHESSDQDSMELECDMPPAPSQGSFLAFRLNYLLVTLVIMLADGLQGMILQGFLIQVVM
jgi:hypothetical protein